MLLNLMFHSIRQKQDDRCCVSRELTSEIHERSQGHADDGFNIMMHGCYPSKSISRNHHVYVGVSYPLISVSTPILILAK